MQIGRYQWLLSSYHAERHQDGELGFWYSNGVRVDTRA
jgi:hypothetical protein